LVYSHFTRNHYPAVYAQIICIVYITTFIQWSIGGALDSGFILAWAFCGPIIALMIFSQKQSIYWLLLYLLNIAITIIFDDFFSAHGHQVSESTRIFFVFMNLSGSSIVVFIFASYFVASALAEKEKANRLLLNILPEKTAQTLKTRQGVIAEKHDDVSVLFADIVNFTQYSREIPPDILVAKLNEIFMQFDDITERHCMEKIKTVGDTYMVVGGLSGEIRNHTDEIASLALDLMSAICKIKRNDGTPFSLRIGIHCGPVVAGVIGKSKFAYDLWGDTVNVASRMESSGTVNCIQVSETVYQKLKGNFQFTKRGTVEIKGLGALETYFLTAKN
jgi:guanylate cyclase